MVPNSKNHSLQRHDNESVRRDAWVEIDLSRLEANIKRIKSWLKQQADEAKIDVPKIMGVVKADGYGHGAVAIAEALAACGVSWLGVASADEGAQLREANCRLPILILGPIPARAVKSALEQKLDLTISSLTQLNELIDLLDTDAGTVPIHMKVDTGMHRLGMSSTDVETAIGLLKKHQEIKLVSVFSHLAIAADSEPTKKQKLDFDRFIEIFKRENYQPDFYHLASSEAAKQFSFAYYDLVRIGMHLYGVEGNAVSSELMPIMSVRGRINQISSIEKNEKVGYGFTWAANRPTRLANIPIGYADGVDRRLSNKMKGLLHGKLINQVGAISMDQMLFDITDVPKAKEGDVITIIGADERNKACIFLADWANELGTTTRELSCRFKTRLSRVHTRLSDTNIKTGKSF